MNICNQFSKSKVSMRCLGGYPVNMGPRVWVQIFISPGISNKIYLVKH